MSETRTVVVHKYPITSPAPIIVPRGVVRHVASQYPKDSLPTIWVEVQPGQSDLMEIAFFATGEPFAVDADRHFIGSAICGAGRLVWHCYARNMP